MKHVYLLETLAVPQQFYVGLTSNPDTRLQKHNAGGSPHTAKFRPWKLIVSIRQSTEHDLRGYMFRSEDEFNVVQFRVDGFTFNRLKPYTSWKSVWPQALELWRKYQNMALPVAITRMALRYINHIELPSRAFRLDDVLTCPPSSDRSGRDHRSVHDPCYDSVV